VTKVTFDSTTNPAGVNDWVLSPDAGQVVWREDSEFFRAPVTGGAPTSLGTFSSGISGFPNYRLAPDGRTLFVLLEQGLVGHYALWVVPTAGGAPIQLTAGVGFNGANGDYVSFAPGRYFFHTDTSELHAGALPVAATSTAPLFAAASTTVFAWPDTNAVFFNSAATSSRRGLFSRATGGAGTAVVLGHDAIPARATPRSATYFDAVALLPDGGLGAGTFTDADRSGTTPLALGPALPGAGFTQFSSDGLGVVVSPDGSLEAWYGLTGSGSVTLGPTTSFLPLPLAFEWGSIANLTSGLVWSRLGVTTGAQSLGARADAVSVSSTGSWALIRRGGALSVLDLQSAALAPLVAAGVTDAVAGSDAVLVRSGTALEVMNHAGGASTRLTSVVGSVFTFAPRTDQPVFFAYRSASSAVQDAFVLLADGRVALVQSGAAYAPKFNSTSEFMILGASGSDSKLVRLADGAVLTIAGTSSFAPGWIGPRRFAIATGGVLSVFTIN
jgi:hypothetical protein